ncbi:MAG TPA: TIGR03620 family F420-dependent LLM class oxidoreductase, partial [Solirubrobacteraceae bacterium]|nr:TIGR03620 family F420-dependent LLM class oxidoreductase [Solirubrobacteraceae bacterium]
MRLGRIGLWVSGHALGEGDEAAAARLAEELGYGALWLGGSPRLTRLRPFLEASERLVLATGIVNVWQYDPAELAAEHAALRADFPGRVLTGVGIGHPERVGDYSRPLSATRGFLDAIDAAPAPIPRDERCLAALGPRMLDLAGERTAGTHPYFTPVAHTRLARERLGPGALVAPEVACVVDDGDRAAAAARRYAAVYLGLANYTRNLLRFGYSDGDLAGD